MEQQQQQQQLQSNDKTVSSEEYRYNPRKPKWWNKLGNNGRGATKAQKRCMKKILDGDGIDNDNNDSGNGNDNGDEVVTGGLTLKLKLRLPTVEYGSKLNWDDVFDADTDTENGLDNNGDDDNKNNNKDKDRDIWLELGFGRGENVSSLLDLNLFNKENNKSKSNNFYLVGAEVSSIGIGCLCRRIDEQFNNNNNNNDNRIIDKNDVADNDDNDKGYVLYHPELDPYYHHDGITDKEVVVDECSNTNTKEKEKEKNQWNSRRRDAIFDHVDYNYSLQKLLLQNHFRIHTGDGYKLLFKIPTNTLANILITFPDPFEKLNDTQYRLVQKQTLLECYRILRKNTTTSNADDDDNGTNNGLLFLATDHEGYYDWCHQMIYEVNNDNNENGNDNDNDDDNDIVPGQLPLLFRLVEPCPNRKKWLPAISRYEQKGWTEGRSTKLSCWQVVVVQ
ncbi:hypothetical protein FRACYDRAFT_249377 [Fragilariopsis cylindrus CCMP1102]|uniref:tRNA (guanine(46)-N(7))-methyltransferase n=1 Tax=Fragilariopsis cylindrus CCMP1102 TaxID=635003 RepID=A0A1E7ET36_9STRA|nr:hypothetical protein FRACYDRAFT_249377 [Fragilariopsis cylindrus CCMP1102]|eukprot:OEU09032.1 hypothetical protein FRACYDRAFT_249377 [Fragilariopsis cylindrus CCMP1102]